MSKPLESNAATASKASLKRGPDHSTSSQQHWLQGLERKTADEMPFRHRLLV
jgi:hypothetical protein